MIRTDVVIIGAGLLGCFTARQLARYELDIVVLEKENDVCRGVSKANTGIIYAGYDHKPGSAKGKLCVQSNREFDELCRELDVPFSRPGSLMVAYGPRADRKIRKKYEDGIAGGLTDISILSGEEAEALEPSLKHGVTSALYSESTGTVDPWELCIAAFENAKGNGARFRFRCEVDGIERTEGGFIISAGDDVYMASAVVNAAGLRSDMIREMVEEPKVRLMPTAADYIVLDRGAGGGPSRVIFHEGENGKGLTLVPTVDGNLLIGPTNIDVDEEECEAEEMRVHTEGLRELRKLCEEVVPGLELEKQIRTFGSLRPNPFRVRMEDGELRVTDESIKDFSITEEDGLFSLIGIKTPGLTFSNEVGRLTADKVTAHLGISEPDPGFDPRRKAIVRARDLSPEERAALAAEDPDYGVIICSCMDVTLAEIRQAVSRGAKDLEGIRRRTGAGMGRCQGSRCRNRILRTGLIDEEY